MINTLKEKVKRTSTLKTDESHGKYFKRDSEINVYFTKYKIILLYEKECKNMKLDIIWKIQ